MRSGRRVHEVTGARALGHFDIGLGPQPGKEPWPDTVQLGQAQNKNSNEFPNMHTDPNLKNMKRVILEFRKSPNIAR
jgi:hypothetical protein